MWFLLQTKQVLAATVGAVVRLLFCTCSRKEKPVYLHGRLEDGTVNRVYAPKDAAIERRSRDTDVEALSRLVKALRKEACRQS